MKIAIKTLGCKSNRADSDKLAEKILKEFGSGCSIAEVNYASDEEKSRYFDVCIVNTCTVTNIADRKSLDAISRFRKIFPNARIVACGCGVRANRDFFEKSKAVDFLAVSVDEILEYLKKNFKKSAKDCAEKNISGSRTRAVVRIQDGCNNFCSYCIIPFARGREKSLSAEDVLDEIKSKEALGFKEIVLTGINIGAYKCGGILLADLIMKILDETKIPRVRLSSIEPQNFSKKFEKLFTDEKYSSRFCPHLHMSLQSGSDKVLKAMRRHYSTELFKKVAQKLKKMATGIALTTDVIVGFPGETEKDFRDTCKFVKEIGFAKVHVFPYSKRAGTKAALMDNQIPENIKKLRAKKLQLISNALQKKFLSSQSGKTFPVLIEQKIRDGYYEGFTPNYVRARIKSKKNLVKQIVSITL